MHSVPSRTLAHWAFLAAALLALLVTFQQGQEPQLPSRPSPIDLPLLREHSNRFVENVGQWPEQARFGLRKRDSMTWFDDAGWTQVKGSGDRAVAIRMGFAGAHSLSGSGDGEETVSWTGEQELSGAENWFVGQDPNQWVRGAKGYGRLRYREVFAGVDVVVRKGGDPRASFEYDLILKPGASVESIVMSCQGQKSLNISADGSLAIQTGIGTLRQAPPLTWAVGADGQRQLLPCRFVRKDAEHFGFEVPGWDGLCKLVIDPGILWSTYLGGSGTDGILAMETDKRGFVTVCGTTQSVDFPTTLGAFDRKFKSASYRTGVFVSQFSADGKRLIWSTYLGGTTSEIAWDLDVHTSGIVTVVGQTYSSDFPTTKGVYQPKFGGAADAFITKLDPTGSKLIWSTYLGGSGRVAVEDGRAVDVDAQGNVVIAGWARGGALPTTTGAYQTQQPSSWSFSPFVAKLGSAGKKLILSTYCGGTNFGMAKTVAIDAKGQITFAGHSGSKDYPVTKGAFQTIPGSSGFNYDAFLTRLDPTGSKLLWSTWIGGASQDTIEELHLDPTGGVIFTGWTRSASFPVTRGVFQGIYGGGTVFRGDAFVSRIGNQGKFLIYSTFLGGQGGESARGLSVDAAGNPTIVGMTGSKDFPVTKGALSEKSKGGSATWQAEGFVARLSYDAKSLLYSTYLGGTGTDSPLSVALLREGDAVVSGSTSSLNFPVSTGAFQTKLKGRSDSFVSKLDLLPTGIARVGKSTDCSGPVLLYPRGAFSAASGLGTLVIGNAPKRAPGVLALGGGASAPGFIAGGATIHLDPQKWIFIMPTSSDYAGRVTMTLRFGMVPKGFRFAAQSIWLNNKACTNKSFFSASAALDITLR